MKIIDTRIIKLINPIEGKIVAPTKPRRNLGKRRIMPNYAAGESRVVTLDTARDTTSYKAGYINIEA